MPLYTVTLACDRPSFRTVCATAHSPEALLERLRHDAETGVGDFWSFDFEPDMESEPFNFRILDLASDDGEAATAHLQGVSLTDDRAPYMVISSDALAEQLRARTLKHALADIGEALSAASARLELNDYDGDESEFIDQVQDAMILCQRLLDSL